MHVNASWVKRGEKECSVHHRKVSQHSSNSAMGEFRVTWSSSKYRFNRLCSKDLAPPKWMLLHFIELGFDAISRSLLSNIHIAVTAMQSLHRHARACFKMVLYVSGKTGQVRNASPKRCCNAATSALWACVRWLSQWSEDGIAKFGPFWPQLISFLK